MTTAPARYYRKDYVEAVQEENGDWFLTRYDIVRDRLGDRIRVSDEAFRKFFTRDEVHTTAKEVSDAQRNEASGANDGGDSPRLEAPSGEQGQQDSRQGGEGIRASGQEPCGRAQEHQQRQIAAAYAVTVDGFISLPQKAIRNPASASVVWMTTRIWEQLATCASPQGTFYIPCDKNLQSAADLRKLVLQRVEESTW